MPGTGPAVRKHNEYFRTVSCNGRKSCPNCLLKLPDGEKIYSWGNYVSARWRTVKHFCKQCFPGHVRELLAAHAGECGCRIDLVGYGGEALPEWLTLD